jgi:hypothetical protein
MKKNAEWLSLVGFVLVTLGVGALALSLVGLRFSFLTWLDAGGNGLGFLLRLLMVVAGFMLVYVAKSNFKGE